MLISNFMRACQIPDCKRPWYSRGWCFPHWEKFWKKIDRTGRKRGNQHHSWRGGTKGAGGRLMVYTPGHPHPTHQGKYVLRSRLVMEKHLGRYLRPGEVVHHRNEDPTDDRLENLELFASNAEHMRVRHMANGRWSVKHDACKECGTTDRKHAAHGLCVNCYHRHE